MDYETRKNLGIVFFTVYEGEDISIRDPAAEYNVSTESISRDITDLKAFFADHRDLVGNTEPEY